MNNLVYKKFYLLVFLTMLCQPVLKESKNIVSYHAPHIDRFIESDGKAIELPGGKETYFKLLYAFYNSTEPFFNFFKKSVVDSPNNSTEATQITMASDNETKDFDKEVFYFAQVNEQDNEAIPLWGAKVASLIVVTLALSILIFLLRKFWRKLK